MRQAAEKDLPLSQTIPSLPLPEKVRLALTGDKEVRSLLCRDPNKVVLANLLQNPRLSDPEVLQMARDRNLPEEILSELLRRKEWIKKYPVRLALVQNPKVPLPSALKLLGTIRDADLRRIARSKDVPSQIAAGARRTLAARGLL